MVSLCMFLLMTTNTNTNTDAITNTDTNTDANTNTNTDANCCRVSNEDGFERFGPRRFPAPRLPHCLAQALAPVIYHFQQQMWK